jgi:hypothetical protein
MDQAPPNRRVLPNRRKRTFDDSIRGAVEPRLLDVDLVDAEALASAVAHMTSKETLSTDRRREIVATIRLLIAVARTKG